MSEHEWIHDKNSFRQSRRKDDWEKRWKKDGFYTFDSKMRVNSDRAIPDCLVCCILSIRCAIFTLIDYKRGLNK